jgi:hypothetical protein
MDLANDNWQRCARKLPLNTEPQLSMLTSTLHLILQNCLSNPTDLKYFKIKVSGKTFQTKIAVIEGGIDFLCAVGFISDMIDNEKYLRLPEFDQDHLEQSVTWLLDTVSTCLEMKQNHCHNKDIKTTDELPCAECFIQIKFPNNTSTTGGFLRYETIHSLHSFACCYFQPGRSVSIFVIINSYIYIYIYI